MKSFNLPRLDKDDELRKMLEKYCRLKRGEVWQDEKSGHKVGCISVEEEKNVEEMFEGKRGSLAVHDPPYNLVAFERRTSKSFINWCHNWVELSNKLLKEDASLYIWLGADQRRHFSPFPEFLMMMRDTEFESRSFITMRNQRGYGTQKNWMSIRQELLYYVKGTPVFNTKDVYTEIPKVLQGYYKEINGIVKENLERSKSRNIRAGNVWVDVQQVFHLLHENVNGCYAQKPLKSIERIISVSSNPGDLVFDFFAHSGSTLIAAEDLNRVCYTIDIDPVFCEITIRRLENFRKTGKAGWQRLNPFVDELINDDKILKYLKEKYNIEPHYK